MKIKAITILIVLLSILAVGSVWADVFELKPSGNSKLLRLIGAIKPTPTPLPDPTAAELAKAVIPQEGYEAKINWGETGKKLVESGAIDLKKFSKNYEDAKWEQWLKFLTESKDEGIRINQENAYFWVNTLWALGLVQESKVLDEGVMGTQYKDQLGNFASTAGWTLGAKKAVDLYSSAKIVDLDDNEQELVRKISSGIYRPCCGNPTSFPDCNHGMAILGLVELMVDQGKSEEEIFEAALAFNSYWFPTTYMDLAYYFQTQENRRWEDVDAKRALSAEFSSAQGYQRIKQEIGNIPGTQPSGGGCGT